MFKLASQQLKVEQRQVFADTLIKLMADNPQIFAIEADLGEASFFTKIQKANPQQFINVGIAEANMYGIAAGLNIRGIVPFVHTFAPFATRRAYDQLFLSCAYAGLTVNIYGSDPGICVGTNGGTHTSFEDIAMLRAIPGIMIFDPADAVQLAWLIEELISLSGVHYIRTNRKAMPSIYQPGSHFSIGQANQLTTGEDLLLVAMGETLHETLQVQQQLATTGLTATVLDMFTIKPFDRQAIINHAQAKRLVVTIENHSINNGLGSAVAEVLSEAAIAVPLLRLGINERFGQVGPVEFLRKDYRLDAQSICEDILRRL